MADAVASREAIINRQAPQQTAFSLDSIRTPIFAVLVAAAYYAGTELGIWLTPVGQPISMLWPPNAILFAALLLAPTRRWAFFLAAIFPVHMAVQLSSGIPVLTAVGWYISNISEALLGAVCVRRSYPPDRPEQLFETFRGIMAFVGFGVLFAPFVTSFLDVGTVVGTGWGTDFWALLRERFFSNMLSNLTLVPPIVVIGSRWKSFKAEKRRYVEAAVLAAVILLIGRLVLGIRPEAHHEPALIYLLLPCLLWAAVRFGSGGASAALLLVALLSIWNSMQGRGPFADKVLSLQIFLAVINIPLLALGAVLDERRRIETVLRENQHLLNLVSEIAAGFVNVSCERIDQQVIAGLERLRNFLSVDRISVFEFRANQGFRHRYSAFASDHVKPPEEFHEHQLVWSAPRLHRGEVVSISDVSKLPETAGEARAFFERGIRSMTIVPLGEKDSLAGILSVISLTRKVWPSDVIAQLQVVGGIFYDAMKRKEAEQALSESEQRFRHTADHSPMLVWMSGKDGLCTYFNRGWLEFTGCEVEQQLGEGWVNRVHPEDVQECTAVYKAAFEARQQFQMEYRLRRHDDEYRWVLDMGVPRFDSVGSFLGFIGSAVDITDRKNAEEAVIGFSGKLINAQEEERRRIARELHDDVGQRLALLAIELDQLYGHSDPLLRKTMLDLLQQTNDIADSVREMSHSLHSAGLDLLPLGAALKALCRDFPHRSSIDVRFIEQNVPSPLPQSIKLCLYRITQEALQNIAKHSRAHTVDVALNTSGDKLFLKIIDDGVGFTMGHQAVTGLGLASMRERLRSVGGTLNITAAPMQGTTIEACVPISQESMQESASTAA